jgi:hypothetical protein
MLDYILSDFFSQTHLVTLPLVYLQHLSIHKVRQKTVPLETMSLL